jgi:hypothetical protein
MHGTPPTMSIEHSCALTSGSFASPAGATAVSRQSHRESAMLRIMDRPLDSAGLFGDDPILGTDESPDRLGRSDFADSTARLLGNLSVGGNSSVVALIGAWGSGKSSMLNMIRSRLDKDTADDHRRWIVVDFNPWFYADLPSLQVGFFRELAAALPRDHSWMGVRDRISSIGQATAPLSSVFAAFGLDPSDAVTALSKLIGGDQSLASIRRSADEALRKADQPVLMVLDDLDRLSPDELLLVFKLLRLTGRLHNVHYLISYDEDTLLDALSRTGLVGNGSPRRAVEYLEKMVQVRLDLPPLRDQQVEAWLNQAIDQLASRAGLDTERNPLQRFSSAYYSLIARRLDTPRSLGRFLAQAEAFLPEDARDFDFEDYLILTWLRTSEPRLYAMLRAERTALIGGRTGSVNSLIRAMDSKNLKEPWVRRLADAHIEEHELEEIADVLGDLFPRFNRDWNESGRRSSGTTDALPPRVGNPDYFDRYFHFGVPDDDISDATVFAAYAQISNGTQLEERDLVSSELPAKAGLIISKLAIANDADPSGSLALLEWLANQDQVVPASGEIFSDQRRLRALGAQVFLKLSAAEVPTALENAAAAPGGLSAVSDWLNRALGAKYQFQLTAEQKAAFSRAQLRFVELVRELFTSQQAKGPFGLDAEVWDLIWDWCRYDADSTREWVAERFRAGDWEPLDVAARLISTRVALGVPNARTTLGNLDFQMLDELVGVDFLCEELAEEISAAATPPWGEHAVDATPENRREYALQLLRQKQGDDAAEK